jgi:signal transduction histidine kinase
MRSTKTTLFAAVCCWTAFVVFVVLAITWKHLERIPAPFSPLDAALIQGWVVACVLLGIATLLVSWLIGQRAIAGIRQLNLALLRRLQKGGSIESLGVKETDSEYQTLVRMLNGLVESQAETNNRLTQFSAKVAHELRSPITLLQLQVDYHSAELEPEFLTALQNQIGRLTDYVDTALVVARAEQGSVPLRKSPQDLAEVFENLIEPYRLRAELQKRALRSRLVYGLKAELDPKIVGLITNNLLTNAFSHGVGDVRVNLCRSPGGASLVVVNRVRTTGETEVEHRVNTGLGLKTVGLLTKTHGGLAYRISRKRDYFAAVLRIDGAESTNSAGKPSTPLLTSGDTSEVAEGVVQGGTPGHAADDLSDKGSAKSEDLAKSNGNRPAIRT